MRRLSSLYFYLGQTHINIISRFYAFLMTIIKFQILLIMFQDYFNLIFKFITYSKIKYSSNAIIGNPLQMLLYFLNSKLHVKKVCAFQASFHKKTFFRTQLRLNCQTYRRLQTLYLCSYVLGMYLVCTWYIKAS